MSTAQHDTYDFKPTGLGEILRNFYVQVPRYQRDFAWDIENVTELLDDLEGAILRLEAKYFLGAVVMTRIGTYDLEVVDGQQRLATTFMIFVAIRDRFIEMGEQTRADFIVNTFLRGGDLAAGQPRPRMTLNATDNGFFQRYIINSTTPASRSEVRPSKPSHQKIIDAMQTIESRIASIAQRGQITGLSEIANYVDQGLTVVRVVVNDPSAAFTIFETLNDRGVLLEISDLIKNFLFAKAESRLNEAEAHWLRMTGIIESIAYSDGVVEFVHHFWSSYHGLTRKKEVFKHAKQTITTASLAVELCENLSRNAKHYAAIFNTRDAYWDRYGEEARRHMNSLNVMKMKQVRPLLLAILDMFRKNDIISSLRLLVSASVRILVSASRGGSIEKLYAELAKKVRTREVRTANQLKNELTQRVPTNAEFRDEFRTARISKDYLARYYLRTLEYQVGGDSAEWEVSDNPSTLNLEHILPKSLNSNWRNFDEESHSSEVTRIGNLCLLLEEENSGLGSQNFEAKKQVFAESSLVLTQEIAEQPTWDRDAIEQRSIRLAELAIHAWPMTGSPVRATTRNRQRTPRRRRE